MWLFWGEVAFLLTSQMRWLKCVSVKVWLFSICVNLISRSWPSVRKRWEKHKMEVTFYKNFLWFPYLLYGKLKERISFVMIGYDCCNSETLIFPSGIPILINHTSLAFLHHMGQGSYANNLFCHKCSFIPKQAHHGSQVEKVLYDFLRKYLVNLRTSNWFTRDLLRLLGTPILYWFHPY